MSKGIYAHFLPAPSFDIDDLLLKRIERRARYYAVGWALIQKWLPIDLILLKQGRPPQNSEKGAVRYGWANGASETTHPLA